jgi:hypothetical protein
MLWRLGGRHNEFTIVGDPLRGFGFQHDVRVLDNGDLLFFDSGLAHSPPESRALEYRLDRKTATTAGADDHGRLLQPWNSARASNERLCLRRPEFGSEKLKSLPCLLTCQI